MPIYLPKGSFISINSIELSEHNRGQAVLNREIIKFDQRTVTGNMRRFYIASKITLEVSWERLPAIDSKTVDGKAGRNTLLSLYNNNIGSVVIVTYKDVDSNNNTSNVTFSAFIDSYSETLIKRYGTHLWDINIKLVEV